MYNRNIFKLNHILRLIFIIITYKKSIFVIFLLVTSYEEKSTTMKKRPRLFEILFFYNEMKMKIFKKTLLDTIHIISLKNIKIINGRSSGVTIN